MSQTQDGRMASAVVRSVRSSRSKVISEENIRQHQVNEEKKKKVQTCNHQQMVSFFHLLFLFFTSFLFTRTLFFIVANSPWNIQSLDSFWRAVFQSLADYIVPLPSRDRQESRLDAHPVLYRHFNINKHEFTAWTLLCVFALTHNTWHF